jgi:dipeptidyl aminopeptidase/acylaminoacyl peptidase
LRAVFSAVAESLSGKLPRYFDDSSTDCSASALTWAPDSRRIACIVRGDLYLATAPPSELRRLTVTRGTESEPAWSADGRWLAFVRDGAVWAIELDGGREMQLSPAGGDSLLPSTPIWSPDGRQLAYTTSDDRGRNDLIVPDFLGDRVGTRNVKDGFANMGIRVVDVSWLYESKDPARLIRDNPFRITPVNLGAGKHPNVSAVAWSPDSRRLAVTEITADLRRRLVHVVEADSGSIRTAHVEADSAWAEEYDWVIVDRPLLEWSPDSRWIYFSAETSGWRHLMRVPAEAGPAEQLTRGAWEMGWAHVQPDGKHVLVLGSRAHSWERQLELLDVQTGALRPLASGPGMSTHPQTGKRGATVLFHRSRFNVPYDLWTMPTRAGASPVQITRSVPESFRRVDWVIPEIVDLPGRDGTPLRGLLYKPRGFDAGRRYPVVVFVHGAGIMQNVVDGWTIYSPNYKFHTVLAEKGYVVFEVDYRGSLGYGRDFRAGIHMYMGGKDLDDELAGVDWLRTHPWVDPQRIGIYGGSYGGFMALMGVFLHPDDYACAAALRFVADWANYYKGNPEYCMQRLGTPEAHPEGLLPQLADPLRRGTAGSAAVVARHARRQRPLPGCRAAHRAPHSLGKHFDLMMYPRESHGFTAAAELDR